MTVPGSVAVVGASLAGLSTVRELRAAGFTGGITVVGDEPHLPYDRPPLSKEFLAPGQHDASLVLADDTDLTGLDAQWLLGHRAIGLSTGSDGRHTVALDGGSAVTADAVVLATGARARWLPGCRALAGVHTLRSLDDARALRDSLSRARRLVVIGAGFIGAEVASTARAHGIDVTVVEMADSPLAGVLGAQIAGACTALHALNGVRLLTGTCVRELLGEGRVGGVVLDDGSRLDADAVVIGIGAVPNTEWIEHPDIDVDRGVRTDARCLTGAPSVYAVGDCARTYDHQLGEHHRSEHWTSATTQARVVAAALLGVAPPRPAAPYFWSHQYGRQLQFAGYRRPGDTMRLVDGELTGSSFVALYERDGVAVGVFAMDNPRLFTKYRKQIERALPAPDAVDEARAEAVLAAVHSAALECGGPSPELHADLHRYQAGDIDAGELVRRTAVRHGAA
jgi:3-phenylpropionate/trans-cinnamate dioxygenase ferredoxin reductase component